MKKVLLVLLVISLFLPVTAYAAPREDVQGDFTYMPTGGCEESLADGNLIRRNCTDVGDYYNGDFLGTEPSHEVYDLVLHGFKGYDELGFPIYDFAIYTGTVTFTGTVAGKYGTMVIKFVGKSPGSVDNWSGTWRIISGTGELANLSGNGDFWSNGLLDVHYEGKIQFDS